MPKTELKERTNRGENDVDSRPDVQPELRSQSTTARQPRVLLLEDDDVQMRLLTMHLESLEFQILEANTIAQARQILHEQIPDLAIFDVYLPDGSGLDLCKEIDCNPRLAGMPIIVLSTETESGIIRKTRASGGIYFVGKPYDPNVLLLLVRQALQ